MTITPYLHFDGECEAALRFYAAALGGEITALNRYEGSPLEAEAGIAYKDKIMHAVLVADDVTIMASDVVPGHIRSTGTSVSLSVAMKDAALGERVFRALARDGQVEMPLQSVFWGGSFGMLTDRFGFVWQVSTD